MRNFFRTFTRSRRHRKTLKLALAPLGVALIPMLLLAQNPEALAAVLRGPGALFARGATALATALRDPADVLAERSPGTRDPNALYSIKAERIAPLTDLASVIPTERVLSVVRDRPGAGPITFGPDSPVADLFPSEPLTFGTPGLTSFAPLGTLPTGSDAPGGFGGPGGAGAAPPLAFSPPTETIVSPPTNIELPSPVPEPATWLMNIIGFFAIAGVLRHSRRVRNLAPLQA